MTESNNNGGLGELTLGTIQRNRAARLDRRGSTQHIGESTRRLQAPTRCASVPVGATSHQNLGTDEDWGCTDVDSLFDIKYHPSSTNSSTVGGTGKVIQNQYLKRPILLRQDTVLYNGGVKDSAEKDGEDDADALQNNGRYAKKPKQPKQHFRQETDGRSQSSNQGNDQASFASTIESDQANSCVSSARGAAQSNGTIATGDGSNRRQGFTGERGCWESFLSCFSGASSARQGHTR